MIHHLPFAPQPLRKPQDRIARHLQQRFRGRPGLSEVQPRPEHPGRLLLDAAPARPRRDRDGRRHVLGGRGRRGEQRGRRRRRLQLRRWPRRTPLRRRERRHEVSKSVAHFGSWTAATTMQCWWWWRRRRRWRRRERRRREGGGTAADRVGCSNIDADRWNFAQGAHPRNLSHDSRMHCVERGFGYIIAQMILQKIIGCRWSSSVFATDGDQ